MGESSQNGKCHTRPYKNIHIDIVDFIIGTAGRKPPN